MTLIHYLGVLVYGGLYVGLVPHNPPGGTLQCEAVVHHGGRAHASLLKLRQQV